MVRILCHVSSPWHLSPEKRQIVGPAMSTPRAKHHVVMVNISPSLEQQLDWLGLRRALIAGHNSWPQSRLSGPR